MQKPKENLDDFLRKFEPKAVPPPASVSLRPTGEVEILKPLARWERPAAVADEIVNGAAPSRLSWFHRSLIFGGGVAVIALIFLSAIFTAISDRSAEVTEGSPDTPGYSSEAPVDGLLASADDPPSDDIFTAVGSPLVLGQLRAFWRAARPKRARPRVRRAVYRARLRAPRPGPVVADFVPTTLIIYPENGQIKTRIEPNLTAAYRKPVSFTR